MTFRLWQCFFFQFRCQNRLKGRRACEEKYEEPQTEKQHGQWAHTRIYKKRKRPQIWQRTVAVDVTLTTNRWLGAIEPELSDKKIWVAEWHFLESSLLCRTFPRGCDDLTTKSQKMVTTGFLPKKWNENYRNGCYWSPAGADLCPHFMWRPSKGLPRTQVISSVDQLMHHQCNAVQCVLELLL